MRHHYLFFIGGREFDIRVEPITYDEIEDPETRELFADFPRNEGVDPDGVDIPNHFNVEAHVPETMKYMLKALQANRAEGDLPMELVKKLYLAVSMTNECTYCTGVYCTNLGTEVGSEEVVREFQEQLTEGELTGMEADVIEFAVEFTEDPHGITDEDFAHLREEYGLTDKDFVQIVFIVNIISGYNRVTTGFDCEHEEVYHAAGWDGR